MTTKCPVCDSTNTRPLIIDLATCGFCGHIFKAGIVKPEAYKSYVSSAQLKVNKRAASNAKKVADMRLKFLQIFKDSGKLLELGCGHELFLNAANNAGFDVEGTELSKALIEQISHKIHYGNPSEIKELDKYDAVCMFHALEHINDPIKEIRILVEHMKTDGVMIIEIPSLLFFDYDISPNDFYEGLHTQYFGQMSLIIFLKRCGLYPIYQTTWWDGNVADTIICAVKDSSDIENHIQKSLKDLLGE